MQALARADLGRLFDALHAEGYRVIGPTLRNSAIVYDEIEGPADLPMGWTDEQAPGRYRLARRDDDAYFGYVVGPHSWKARLFPSREPLFQARRRPDGRVGFDPVIPEEPKEAFLGVRACEVAAIEVQDRVFLEGPLAEPRYAARRRGAFLVGVSCLEPGDLCFCVSTGTGPRVDRGVDLSMVELPSVFLLEAGTDRGRAILERLPARPATEGELRGFDEGIREARGRMGRAMDTRDLPELLFGNLDHPRWEAVAQRCLACGNCTSVCPTCFCASAHEESDLTGSVSSRVRTWDSCFSEEHAAIHGANVRPTTADRYRQWLTHKVGSWVAQFGTSGCVGCGRCIAWCPVGIDLTEEIAAIRADAAASVAMPAYRPPAAAADDALVPRVAEVVGVTRESADVVTLHLACDPPLRAAPGQFTMLSIPAVGEAAISISGVRDDAVEQTIRDVGAVSKALTALRPGQQLGVRGPYGNGWPLDEARGRPVVAIVGGIGIAPLRGAIRRMIDHAGDYPDVRLVYGARTPEDLLFAREMLGWAGRPGFHLEITVDRADPSWRGDVGVVTRLLRRTPMPVDATYLMCGPEIMMRFTVDTLVGAGVPAERMFASMERHMKCAAGFCGRCQYGPYFVCKDGPIFRYDALALLFGREGF
jgi:NAD(P)H-flavin reductase/formate hydrogenlyase subunit 6/NADH:ubiquinone oxidoreductase subunit I